MSLKAILFFYGHKSIMLTPEFNSPRQLNSMKSASNGILILDIYIKDVGLVRAFLSSTKPLCQSVNTV